MLYRGSLPGGSTNDRFDTADPTNEASAARASVTVCRGGAVSDASLAAVRGAAAPGAERLVLNDQLTPRYDIGET
jgi:hypothetical protein